MKLSNRGYESIQYIFSYQKRKRFDKNKNKIEFHQYINQIQKNRNPTIFEFIFGVYFVTFQHPNQKDFFENSKIKSQNQNDKIKPKIENEISDSQRRIQ